MITKSTLTILALVTSFLPCEQTSFDARFGSTDITLKSVQGKCVSEDKEHVVFGKCQNDAWKLTGAERGHIVNKNTGNCLKATLDSDKVKVLAVKNDCSEFITLNGTAVYMKNGKETWRMSESAGKVMMMKKLEGVTFEQMFKIPPLYLKSVVFPSTDRREFEFYERRHLSDWNDAQVKITDPLSGETFLVKATKRIELKKRFEFSHYLTFEYIKEGVNFETNKVFFGSHASYSGCKIAKDPLNGDKLDCLDCKPTEYVELFDFKCGSCQRDSFHPTKWRYCYKCVGDIYKDDLCQNCTANFNPNPSKDKCVPIEPIKCGKGKELDVSTNECKNCTAGTYSDDDSACKSCPDIISSDLFSCVKECKLNEEEVNKVCVPCKGNMISPIGIHKCIECNDGMETIKANATCKNCEENTISLKGVQCKECPPNEHANTAKTKCGTHCPVHEQLNGTDYCVTCPEKMVSGDGENKCKKCPVNTEPNDDFSGCRDCAEDEVSIFGEKCLLCSKDKYLNPKGDGCYCLGNRRIDLEKCIDCPEGTVIHKLKNVCEGVSFLKKWYIYLIVFIICALIVSGFVLAAKLFESWSAKKKMSDETSLHLVDDFDKHESDAQVQDVEIYVQ